MILAVDQGTTATTCLVVDEQLRIAGRGSSAVPQHFPQPGWVEHDPHELWDSVVAAAAAALVDARLEPAALDVVAITNQRETTVLWDRRTGDPVDRAIVWQDRRTAERCATVDRDLIRERTGLVPDPYFSATKLEWLLQRHDARGLAFGTVDSWLAWRLTRGTRHVTDVTNASRTMLCSLKTRDWDDELLALFGVDRSLLPEVLGSADEVGEGELLGAPVVVRGIAGDQQAALFGHGCHRAGDGKATYGTGSFVLVHTGADASAPPHGLLRTVAADGFALEGAVLVAGAALQWLRDGLGVIGSAAESEALARSVPDTGGVVFVPALAGLGSPWWDAGARGLVTGLTRGTSRAHLVRAALEAIAHQVADVVEALPEPVRLLKADGGATGNAFLMQLQSDLLGLPVQVASEQETTALGVAALAAGGDARVPAGTVFEPRLDPGRASEQRARWRTALDRARSDFGP